VSGLLIVKWRQTWMLFLEALGKKATQEQLSTSSRNGVPRLAMYSAQHSSARIRGRAEQIIVRVIKVFLACVLQGRRWGVLLYLGPSGSLTRHTGRFRGNTLQHSSC
jgi:hypothetical protein